MTKYLDGDAEDVTSVGKERFTELSQTYPNHSSHFG